MLINNDAIRKMLIEVDADKITDEAAMKLVKILNYICTSNSVQCPTCIV